MTEYDPHKVTLFLQRLDGTVVEIKGADYQSVTFDPLEIEGEHNAYCNKAGAYPRSHPCKACMEMSKAPKPAPTHLDMFTSDDGKRGRIWREIGGYASYKREGGLLLKMEDGQNTWMTHNRQVADMTSIVKWADEPQVLSPQEAMRAMADGRIINRGVTSYRLRDFSVEVRTGRKGTWRVGGSPYSWHGFVVEPEPDYVHAGEPITKVRDDMRDYDCGPLGPQHSHTEFDSAGNITYPPNAAKPPPDPEDK